MKKILFSANVFRHFTSFHLPYMKMLMAKGFEVVAIANEDYGGHKEQLETIGIRCIAIPLSRNPLSRNNFKSYRILKNTIKNESFDIIHVHTPVAAFLTRLAFRNVNDGKLIYTAHGFHFFKDAPLVNWLIYFPLEKLAAPYTSLLITTNKEDTVTAKKLGFNNDRLKHIKGVGVEVDNPPLSLEEKQQLKESLNITDDQCVITCVAEMNNNKNQMFLLRNWKAIKERAPHAVLLFAGIGPNLDSYQQYVVENELQDIQFLGFRKDVPKLLQISDMMTLLSLREGLPKSVMEGMAEGLPCIVTNTRGLVDLVEDNVNGYVIEKDNDVSLVQSFANLANHSEERERMGNNSRRLVKDFSLNAVMKDYESSYNL
ncbi:glycosyltransferase family 4 protein [Macrococcus lamae]|uniref:Glycosyltransferase family 1 protein n=1 Tax=Macrococcus lamae TaxID=198484 RepID=A0A4R6BW08_9STAP|nr:glycosyltransferase family 4 protein [Macrococcus lamae]TDM12389.1 glycosyltransferase family 1 protein [Macrococcus lamae]